jgi:hypothetical protein
MKQLVSYKPIFEVRERAMITPNMDALSLVELQYIAK